MREVAYLSLIFTKVLPNIVAYVFVIGIYLNICKVFLNSGKGLFESKCLH